MDLRDRLEKTLGNSYTIERELGGGGMSRVFLATETALGRQVVVKILSEDLASGISADRFTREVRVAASLQHPNIVPLLTAGVADGIPYYTMPFVRGESLRTRMNAMGTLPVRQTASILRDMARALHHAHGEGVIHRDIKPENVLLAGDAAVVTDFGIAKAVSIATTIGDDRGEIQSPTLTQAGISVGTPAYMAPEQVAGDAVDQRTDIYSWGIVAYELLAGAHPFADRAGGAQMMAAQIGQMPADLDAEVGRIPAGLAKLVMQCVAKNPGHRPSTAADLIEQLDLARESRDNPTVARKSMRQRRVYPAIAGAAIVGVAIIAFLLFKGISGKPAVTPPSVAVLPFAHDQADSTEAYLGEGLADELMTSLAKVPGLRVASRTSAIAMGKQKDLDIRQIASRLGVTSIVEGTVRRHGGKLRVSAQLTNASDGLTIWSESYDRDAKDVIEVQAAMSQAIVSALHPVTKGSRASARQTGPGTSDPEAYDFYLRALYLVERRGPAVALSVDYFSKAIAKDPGFARAYAGLAGALELLPYFGGVPAHIVEARTKAAAERALQLDPSLAEPRVALAMLQWHALRWDEADAEFRKAIKADSTSAVAHTQYGRFLITTGKNAEAIDQLRIARRLDPLASTSSVWLAQAFLYSGDRQRANEESRKSREMEPNLINNQTLLVLDIVRQGRISEALAIIPDEIPITPFDGMTAYNLERAGAKTRAAALRKRMESMPDSVWMVHTARAYGFLGARDTASALSEIESAVRSREIIASIIPLPDPVFDDVRGSDRFGVVVERLGLAGRGLTEANGGRAGAVPEKRN